MYYDPANDSKHRMTKVEIVRAKQELARRNEQTRRDGFEAE